MADKDMQNELEQLRAEVAGQFDQLIKQKFAQVSSDVERIRSGFFTVSGALGSAQAGPGSMSPV